MVFVYMAYDAVDEVGKDSHVPGLLRFIPLRMYYCQCFTKVVPTMNWLMQVMLLVDTRELIKLL